MSSGFQDAVRQFNTLTSVDTDKDILDIDFDLSDFIDGDPDAITHPTWKDEDFFWNKPVCECGSWKTYGNKCSSTMHSDWCPVKRK